MHLSDIDLLNPKSTIFAQYRGLLLCQVSSHCDQEFSFHRANIHTHSVTKWSQCRRRPTTSSARLTRKYWVCAGKSLRINYSICLSSSCSAQLADPLFTAASKLSRRHFSLSPTPRRLCFQLPLLFVCLLVFLPRLRKNCSADFHKIR